MSDNFELRVLVSIVNYCSAELVCRMLPGLVLQLNITTDRIVVVDNQSPDDSYIKLKSFVDTVGLSDVVEIVSAEINGGFSYGNNLALATAIEMYGVNPKYFWLLNPDTQVQDKALDALIDFMQTHQNAGILGSRLEGEDGVVQGSAFRFQSLMSELLSSLRLGCLDRIYSKYLVSPRKIETDAHQCDWVAGASMFVRHEVIEDAGMMDEHYFLYFEETDFCLQAVKSGWECWYVPSSRVIHYVGQSTGIVSGDVERRRRPKYWFESRQYYFLKNHGLLYTIAADFLWGVGFALLQVRYFLQRKQSNDPEYMLRDFWRNSIFLSWL